MPLYSSINFEGTVAQKKCQITVDLTADYDQPIPSEIMREILVQVAIKLTNPAELQSLARDLATPGAEAQPADSAKRQESLAPPLLRTKLKRLK